MRLEANQTPPAPQAAAARDIYKWDNEFLPNKMYGAEKWSKEAPDSSVLADKLENKAMAALDAQHKALSITNGDENARVFPFEPKFKVAKERTALQLAQDELGGKASKTQVEYYAKLLLEINNKEDKPLSTVFKAKSTIKMPGQTFDGGLTVLDEEGNKKTSWQDDSFLLLKANGDANAAITSDENTRLISWSASDADKNNEKTLSEKEQRTANPDGSWSKETLIGKDGTFGLAEKSEIDAQGRTLHSFITAGTDTVAKLSLKKPGEKPVLFERNKDGDLLTKDGNSGITELGVVYKIHKLKDGGQERVHENGTEERLDAKGNLLSRQGLDEKGRQFNELYKNGDAMPYQVQVTINKGEKPTEFSRTEGGRFVAPYLLDGKKVGEIELAKGIFDFKNKATQVDKIVGFDGETLETFNLPFTNSKTIETSKRDKIVTEFDRDGNKKSRTFSRGNEVSISKLYNSSGAVDSMTIDTKLGHANLTNNRDVGKFLGEAVSKDGKTAGVYVAGGKLLFPAEKGDLTHMRALDLPTGLDTLAHPVQGRYNEDLRTVTTVQHRHKLVESLDAGRLDIVNKDGSIKGSTKNGETSSLKPTGEAMVVHSDSAVRLNADGTIDRWGPGKDDSAKHEASSPLEKAFIEKNKSFIDLRDIAEIHRRFKGDKAQLDGLYQSLAKVDGIPGFTVQEKQTLVDNILRHIANPADIYQGSIGTCNVTVIQRELAISDPQRYVSMLVDAASNTLVDSTTGKKVELDPNNLKMRDLSERDLASRIFQSMALNVLYAPGKYLQTPDTTGRLYDKEGNLMDFNGLNMAQITVLAHKLTGKEHSQVLVNSGEELLQAFEKNGGRPMTIGVDARKPPFTQTDEGTGGHVVTITKIERNGTGIKAYTQNQWGLAEDHSTPETTFDADELAENMKDEPLAIILGPQNKVFKIEDGKFEIDEEATRKQLAELERSMN